MDLEFVEAAERETARLTFGREFTNAERKDIRQRFRTAAASASRTLAMAVCDDERLGYFWFEPRAGGVAWILDFYVARGFRRRGVGRRLLQELIDRATRLGCGRVEGGVDSSNAAMRGLLAGAGFVPVREHDRGHRRRIDYGREVARSPDT